MIVERSFAKINLYLRVIRRREDGYHDLDTLFQEIDVHDDLVFEPGADALQLYVHGPDTGPVDDNLIIQVARHFEATTGLRVGGSVKLTKRIPPGGGLGGGSSNAATFLKMLNCHFGFPLSREELLKSMLNLGSDVPFFLDGGTQRGRGRGERLTPENPPDLPIEGWLILPGFGIPTGRVFQALRVRRAAGEPRLGENDLWEPALACSSELAALSQALQPRLRGRTWWMTGSGSTLVVLGAEMPKLQGLNVNLQPFRFRWPGSEPKR